MLDHFGCFLKNLIGYSIAFSFLGFLVLIIFPKVPQDYLLIGIVSITIFIASFKSGEENFGDAAKEFSEKEKEIDVMRQAMSSKLDKLTLALKNSDKQIKQAKNEAKNAAKDAELWRTSLIERSSGFPSLLNQINLLDELRDRKTSRQLLTKSHPAVKSAEVVMEETRKRRESEFNYRRIQSIIEYYESVAPFLIDLKDEPISEEEEIVFRNYDNNKKLDPAANYLSNEDYQKLPSVERNQMALDRFRQRKHSNWVIGILYERFVGKLYEEQNYNVNFVGIKEGKKDLGRDLICKNENEIIVIQCKNWASFKTIHEKHIFQFFGTVFQYKYSNPNKKVRGVFYTTTQLSDLSKAFANELGIEIKENFKFEKNYPCIKCNISKVDKEKIYHLPFDQQYDNVKIEQHLGEFYCSTVKEAEDAGFRRAFRWSGNMI